MNFGGIIAGAIAGGGQALAEIGTEQQRFNDQTALAQQQSDLAEQKAEALAQFNADLKIDSEDRARQMQADRINAAATPIQQGIIASKANAAYGGDSNLSYDDLSPEEVKAYATTPSEDRSARVQAAEQTGDLDPKTIATLSDREVMAQLRAETQGDRTAMMEKIANIRADAAMNAAQLRVDAANQRATDGKVDTATGRMLITSEDANIKAATAQMSMLNSQLGNMSPKDKRVADIQAQIKSLQDDIAVSRATKNAYLKGMGFPTADDVQPAPRAATSNTGTAPKWDTSNPQQTFSDIMKLPSADRRAALAQAAPAFGARWGKDRSGKPALFIPNGNGWAQVNGVTQ